MALKLFAILVITPYSNFVQAQPDEKVKRNGSLESMDISELLSQRTDVHRESDTASATTESMRDTPGALIVIDHQDIERRGYDSIDDIFIDLPSFDTIVAAGTEQIVTYQRGYRTPWTQRTLFLINGKVDNNLWMHGAAFSRQYPMNQIERIEILYGPTGAVYGPNAFLGVINVITKTHKDLLNNEHVGEITALSGSFETQAIDFAFRGKVENFGYAVGLRWFRSDEPGIDDYADWGYLREADLYNPQYWGPGIGLGVDPINPDVISPAGDTNVDGVVNEADRFHGITMGGYEDPSKNYGIIAESYWKSWTLGWIKWKTEEGYGPYYSTADAQSALPWIHTSDQIYINNVFDYNEKITVSSDAVYRENTTGGDWAEAFAGYVSLSEWLSSNKAWRVEQHIDFQLSPQLLMSGGLKYEKKTLTKGYVICNYWDGLGFCPAQDDNSSNGLTSDGSGVIPVDEINSLNPTPFLPTFDDSIPDFNQLKTTDKGIFAQAIYDWGVWRFNAGIRWDENSEYGGELSPRGAVIYHWGSRTTFKLMYGKAFQEPSPKDLYGNWSGRDANADLEPEKVRTLELIALHQTRHVLYDASFFYNQYQNVITSSANIGERDIYGTELKVSYRFNHWMEDSKDITGHFFYTYTKSMAEQQFDNVIEQWIEHRADQGDIAPHKLNFMLNVPIKKSWNVNLRANWSSRRQLFSENPLRADSNSAREFNRKAESFVRVDMHTLYRHQNFQWGLKIENLLEEDYLLPGVEGAGSGDDFTVDNDGFNNSLIPQVNKRIYTLTLKVEL